MRLIPTHLTNDPSIEFSMKPEETAHKWANTRKGAWRVAHSQIFSTKLTNGILKKNGWCWRGMHRVNGMGR